MGNLRQWVRTWLGASVGVAAALLWLATVTVSPAAAEAPAKDKAGAKPAQGQQLCIPGPNGTCRVNPGSPPAKAPEQAPGQTTKNSPPAKQGGQQQQKPKSD